MAVMLWCLEISEDNFGSHRNGCMHSTTHITIFQNKQFHGQILIVS